jgi:hypothetical protein
VIVGLGRDTLILPIGTQLVIEDALSMYSDSTHTLLSYKNIRHNGFHVEHIMTTRMNIYSSLKSTDTSSKCLRKFLHYQLDCISYTSNPYNVAYKIIFQNLDVFKTWHDCLGHLGIGWCENLSEIHLVITCILQNFPSL